MNTRPLSDLHATGGMKKAQALCVQGKWNAALFSIKPSCPLGGRSDHSQLKRLFPRAGRPPPFRRCLGGFEGSVPTEPEDMGQEPKDGIRLDTQALHPVDPVEPTPSSPSSMKSLKSDLLPGTLKMSELKFVPASASATSTSTQSMDKTTKSSIFHLDKK